MTFREDSYAERRARNWLDGRPDEGYSTINISGLRYYAHALLARTQNQFHERFMWFVLHDRLATSSDAGNARMSMPHLLKLREIGARDLDYRTLLLEMGEDPLMMQWLNLVDNTVGSPNQNYARELMELFTLDTADSNGNPNYTLDDIREIGRAFTGWQVGSNTSLEFRYYSYFTPARFDPGTKTIFAGTSWQAQVVTGRDVVNHIFDHHPNAAPSLAKWLAREYFGNDSNGAVISELASIIYGSDFNLRAAFERLLSSQYFYAPERRLAIIKHPSLRQVHLARAINVLIGDPENVVNYDGNGGDPYRSLGCVLTDPDSVFGCDRALEMPLGSRILNSAVSLRSMITGGDSVLTGYAWSEMNMGLVNLRSFLPSPTATAAETLDHLLATLALELTPQQRDLILTFAQTRRTASGTISDPWPGNDAALLDKLTRMFHFITLTPQFFQVH